MHNERQMQQKRHAQYLVFVLIVRDWEIVKLRGCEQGLASGTYDPTRHPVIYCKRVAKRMGYILEEHFVTL